MFVDEQASVVPCDLLTALLAREVLAHEPGATIVYDLRSSRAVPETVEAAGGRAVEERVGSFRRGISIFCCGRRENKASISGLRIYSMRRS